MEQSVCMSLPDARPIAHLLLNSSVTARAAVVPRPNNKAPAKADVMLLRIGFVLGVAGWGSLPPSFISFKAVLALLQPCQSFAEVYRFRRSGSLAMLAAKPPDSPKPI